MRTRYLNIQYYNKRWYSFMKRKIANRERNRTRKNRPLIWEFLRMIDSAHDLKRRVCEMARLDSILWSYIGARSAALHTSRPIIGDAAFRNQRQFVIVIMRTILLPRVNYRAKMWRRPTTINTAAFARRGVIAGCHITSIVACIEYPCIQSLMVQPGPLVPRYFTIVKITTVIPRRLNCDWFTCKSRGLSFEKLALFIIVSIEMFSILLVSCLKQIHRYSI